MEASEPEEGAGELEEADAHSASGSRQIGGSGARSCFRLLDTGVGDLLGALLVAPDVETVLLVLEAALLELGYRVVVV